MPFEIALSVFTYTGVTAFALAFLWPFRAASPIFWYPVSLGLIAIGIFLQIDFSHASDGLHILLSFLGLIGFSASAIAYSVFFDLQALERRFRARPLTDDTHAIKFLIFLVFIVSLLMTLVYFQRTGGNIILMALRGTLDDDFSGARLAMYAGDTYMAAGYFNQFKNFLLPLTSALIFVYLRFRYKMLSNIFGVFLFFVCILAVAGTGQRTYLLFSFLSVVFGFILYNAGTQRIISFKMIIISFIVFAGFSMMTALYKDTNESVLDTLLLSLERIFFSQQWAGLVAFQFVYDRPIVWLDEWIDSLRGLLPGHRGSILANEIHDYMFSSFRGTAPPTLIGSAYHNGGVWLVAIFFFILGAVYAFAYHSFLLGKKSPSRCFTYGAIFFYSVTFFVGPIKYPLDNGIAAFMILSIMLRLTDACSSRASGQK